jgi:ribosomal protein L11 methyltransferase
MKYIVADFTITCEDGSLQTCKDLLADMAGNAGFESFEDNDTNHLKGYVQEECLDKNALDNGIADFPIEHVEISYTLQEMEDKDWNSTWEEEGFEPINIQDKVLVFDAKQPLSSFQILPSTIAIAIDAKLAFGTGTHQTTQMVISALLQEELKDKRVLDCGCGTGILSIAASKLGAQECIGYDIDEWSVKNAKHNAEINQVDNLSVFHGDSRVLSHINGVFDIVMANINRNILLKDMDKFKEVMSGAQATLILSGFYEEDIPLLLEKATSLGLHEKSRNTDDHWACLILEP